jgi:hypothetical protein
MHELEFTGYGGSLTDLLYFSLQVILLHESQEASNPMDDKHTRAIVFRLATSQYIQGFRGILKHKRRRKPVTTQLLKDRAWDLKREEAKLVKHYPR